MLGLKTMASMQACCFLHDSYGLCRSKRDVAFAWEKDARKATRWWWSKEHLLDGVTTRDVRSPGFASKVT